MWKAWFEELLPALVGSEPRRRLDRRRSRPGQIGGQFAVAGRLTRRRVGGRREGQVGGGTPGPVIWSDLQRRLGGRRRWGDRARRLRRVTGGWAELDTGRPHQVCVRSWAYLVGLHFRMYTTWSGLGWFIYYYT